MRSLSLTICVLFAFGNSQLLGRLSSIRASSQMVYDEFYPILPKKVSITLGDEGTITFDLREHAATAISIQFGSSHFAVPEAECRKLHDIDFGSTYLEWDPLSDHAMDSPFFAIHFTMGTESDKSFGELPKVMLYFDEHKFTSVVIRRKTSENTWLDGDH